MKRGVLAGITGAILLSGAVFAWNAVRQEREFRRLIAAGDAAIARDQTYEAIEAFSGALALKNDSMLAYLKRGDSYRRRGELSAALRDLREASSVDPTATRPLELLGDVNIAMGRYERATEAYRRYLALDDRAPHVLYKLALALYRNGQAQAALEPLRRAVALDDRFAEAHYLLAMCLEDQRHDDDAVRSFTRALEINPALGAAREELAVLQLAHGRTREGIEQLEALAALEPSQPQRLVNVGLAYARAGRTDAAITALGRAAERYPEADGVYVALGQVWLETAEAHNDRVALSKSLEALQPAASRPDATSDTLTLYGRALFLSGTVDEAERTLELAASRFPANPNAFLYLAAAAERRGHVTAAREALARHLGLVGDHPTDPALLALRADVQFRLGQVDAARASIAEGLTIDQRNAALLQLRRKIG
ncbi:MAG TPA: tetratricopeptide repeat protein [Vicinamibacterales bacterium]|nr:tetratricopeptide repeat protein [Vicinamibacterales bacterium]